MVTTPQRFATRRQKRVDDRTKFHRLETSKTG